MSSLDSKLDISNLYNNIQKLIEISRNNVSVKVNSEITLLYYNIGKTIKENILKFEKPEYGKAVIKQLSEMLMSKYGRGYSQRNIFKMVKFYEYFKEVEILPTVSAKLSWSHFVEILQIKEAIKRKFYLTMCIHENWSVRVLRERIDSALYERTLISKKPEETIINELNMLEAKENVSEELFFRDPYVLDFLDLKDTYSEKDLENSILSELQKFILELGSDFAFLNRQKRITIDGQDYYIDLLFYHRSLKRLVVIELKLERFKPEHKGQVELYLKWLNKYERQEGENEPIALILCASKSDAMAELLELSTSGIHVAEYITKFIPKTLIEEKLINSIKNAKIMLDQRNKKDYDFK